MLAVGTMELVHLLNPHEIIYYLNSSANWKYFWFKTNDLQSISYLFYNILLAFNWFGSMQISEIHFLLDLYTCLAVFAWSWRSSSEKIS